jgi:hypothetical protein
MPYEDQTRRLITEKCLIAADVDQTILSHVNDRNEERLAFFRRIAPQLVESARLGAHVGFVTGNSMHELTSRFLDSLVHHLCHTGDLAVISRFHFFCNSGGVYFHFADDVVKQTYQRLGSGDSDRLRKNFWHATTKCEVGDVYVRSRYVDAGYIERSCIQEADAKRIETILQEVAGEYWEQVTTGIAEHGQKYDLSWVRDKDGSIVRPKVESRSVLYRFGTLEKRATVQITLKPVLSFRQARAGYAEGLLRNDFRSQTVRMIQERLDREGLGHYVGRPGGRGSIDVTLERLDKAYALEFLIDRLRLQGDTHRGQLFGSNSIYLGDEVMVGGGNDYPVTRIPGLLVFAVNRDRGLVPFLSDIFVPSAIFEGPEAASDVLAQFNHCARCLLKEYRSDRPIKTAIEALKEEIFSNRIVEKIGRLKSLDTSVEEWQTLHTFVTLIARGKAGAKHWPALLVKQLDAIMTQIMAESGNNGLVAPGASHPDS